MREASSSCAHLLHLSLTVCPRVLLNNLGHLQKIYKEFADVPDCSGAPVLEVFPFCEITTQTPCLFTTGEFKHSLPIHPAQK